MDRPKCWMIQYLGHIVCYKCKHHALSCGFFDLLGYYQCGTMTTLRFLSQIEEIYKRYDDAWERYEPRISIHKKNQFGLPIEEMINE